MLTGLVGEQLAVKFVPISFTSDRDRKRVLVAVGVMNMAWMAGVTAVVFVEKVWRSGEAFGYAVGGAMILTGLLLPWLPPMQATLLS